MQEAVKAEILKLLDNGIIYPISNSQWVSPVHAVPKKSGFTMVENENQELVQTRLPTKIRVCIDYQKLNDATHKDHFSLSFIDQMLERLAGHEYYCFLDDYSGYNEIPITPEDQEKQRLLVHLGLSLIAECLSVYTMPLRHSSVDVKPILWHGQKIFRDLYGWFLHL